MATSNCPVGTEGAIGELRTALMHHFPWLSTKVSGKNAQAHRVKSGRNQELLSLWRQGWTAKELAARFNIGVSTVSRITGRGY